MITPAISSIHTSIAYPSPPQNKPADNVVGSSLADSYTPADLVKWSSCGSVGRFSCGRRGAACLDKLRRNPQKQIRPKAWQKHHDIIRENQTSGPVRRGKSLLFCKTPQVLAPLVKTSLHPLFDNNHSRASGRIFSTVFNSHHLPTQRVCI